MGMITRTLSTCLGICLSNFTAGSDNVLSNYGVESFTAVKRRIKDLMDEITEKEHDKNVLMITYLDSDQGLRSLFCLTLKLEALFHWHIRNSALTIL